MNTAQPIIRKWHPEQWLPLLALVALLAGIFGVSPAAAQSPDSVQQFGCNIRTDWPTYSVVRGDSVSRIARRFGTTTRVLIDANCLANANRIYVGQLLRVPATGGIPTPGPISNFNVGVSYQQFENGFMIWRSDNGLIWVFGNNGQLLTYPLSGYGWRYADRSVVFPPPNRYAPNNGFLKVWYNFAQVRSLIGWATTPTESGHLMNIRTVGDATSQTVVISLPDGRSANLYYSNWNYTDGSTNPITWSTGASYQQFENGYMLWRAVDGQIWVLSGLNGGSFQSFSVSQYAWLPLLPLGISDVPPAGGQAPINGFGKVWRNFPEIRRLLGWATTGEGGFTMNGTTTSPTSFTFNLHDNRAVRVSTGGWTVTSGPIVPPTPTATVTGTPVTPTPTSTPAEPRPGTTAAAFQTYENGYMLWRQDTGEIRIFYGTDGGITASYPQQNYANLPDNPVALPTPPGRVRPTSGFGKVWGNFPEVRSGLGWATAPEQGYTMTYRTVSNQQGGSSLWYSLPDGRNFIEVNRNWNFDRARLPFDETPEPRPADPVINSFTADVMQAAPGTSVTVRWETTEVAYTEFVVYDTGTNTALQYLENQPASGSTVFAIPRNISGDLRIVLTGLVPPFGDSPTPDTFERAVERELVVDVVAAAPISTPEVTVEAPAQPDVETTPEAP
ncbi:MAG: LysM domain-containing protein [bacterium]|nr:LysM domain-containing protein [bacterium]